MPAPCPYARPILTGDFGCSQSHKYCEGEHEGVDCGDPVAQMNCLALLSHLKANATFALKLSAPDAVLTHGQEMKLRCGGLLGLFGIAYGEQDAQGVPDIHALVRDALAQFGSLDRLPYHRVVSGIAAYRLRPGADR